MDKPANVDAYIGTFDPETGEILTALRELIKATVPEAEEKISYGMPAYHFGTKPLIYFAAIKKHIGVYALPESNKAFAQELISYKTGKGSIQFPLDKPMPYNLIKTILQYRVKEINSTT
jgi:uncharacterized protein YdhG (YjbR/CyaY superfamily)